MGGVVGDGDEGGALSQGQLAHRLAKILLRRRGHAIAAVAQIDDVEIPLDGLVLGVGLVELQRLENLQNLPPYGGLIVAGEVLDELLSDGGAAAEVLAEMEIHSADDMIEAAKKISDTYHCAVLCKGGHKLNDANDLLYRDGDYRWFNGKRIDNPNTHGTGCTLSSAIASNLAKGFPLKEAIVLAKEYISGALGTMLDLGKGSGPMNHAFDIHGKFGCQG